MLTILITKKPKLFFYPGTHYNWPPCNTYKKLTKKKPARFRRDGFHMVVTKYNRKFSSAINFYNSARNHKKA